jgi:hypothetical protein
MSILTEAKKEHHHGPGCGHLAVEHNGHTDYLRQGHLEHPEGDHVEEHKVAIDQAHPDCCTHGAEGHPKGHVHGPNCGHPAVPHGDHIDYLVEGHLHHPHEGHCDDHGALKILSEA